MNEWSIIIIIAVVIIVIVIIVVIVIVAVVTLVLDMLVSKCFSSFSPLSVSLYVLKNGGWESTTVTAN